MKRLLLLTVIALACFVAWGRAGQFAAQSDADITVHFVPVDSMSSYEQSYVPGNWGFVAISWNGANEIYDGKVLLGTDLPTQEERNHLIREELTQGLGLLQDSIRYSDSIFYQGWTSTQEYADIDRKVIEILYHEDVHPDMTRDQIMSLSSLTSAYTEEEIAYFLEIALGAEYSNASRVIRKWSGDLRISVHGSPTAADRATLAAVASEINAITGDSLHLTIES